MGFVSIFCDKVSLYGPDCPGTRCVKQADPELALIRHISLQSARTAGMCQHTQQTLNVTQN